MTIEKVDINAMAGATPMTIADAVVRECPDKEILEDVVYYINAYITREWSNKTHTKEGEADEQIQRNNRTI